MTYSAQTGSGTMTFQNGTTTLGNATLTVGPTSVTLNVGPGGLLLGLDTWEGTVSGVWDGGTLNWKKDGVAASAYADGDAVTFDDSGSNAATISSGAPVAPASVFFNNNAKNYTVSAVITGSTTLVKTGAATTTLTGSNTFTGATTISGGTLQISGAGRLNTGNYGGAMALGNGAAFEQNANGAQTLSGNVTGTGGTLRVIGGAGLILSGAGNSFGTLSVNNANTRAFINNAGALPTAATVHVTAGALVLGTGASYSSSINVSSGAGIATRRSGGTSLTGTVDLPGNGSVVFNNDDASTYELTITGDQTLTGDLTVQVGGTRMNAGTGALGGVTLSGKLTGSGSLTMTSSGDGSNLLTGTGKLTLTGPNDYTGDTTVSSGVLAITGNSIANTGKLIIDGGIVDLTNSEIVNSLFFGAVQQPDGTYSASSVPGGATITTASFSGTGTLTVGAVTPSGFSAWQSANGTAGTIDQDHDNDGVDNGVEFFIYGPVANSGFTPLPGVDNTGGTLSVTWTKAAGYTGAYNTDFVVETSSTLSGAWTPAVEGASPGQVLITGNDVKYTFSAGTRNFARLKVTGP
jgi:autotransporter-associated beta strand protein